MKSFKEFTSSQGLDEGLIRSGIRTGSVLSHARRAKTAGDKAGAAFERGRTVLKRGQADEGTSDRLKRLETALDASLIGHIHTRNQIGSLVAAVVAGQIMRRKQRR